MPNARFSRNLRLSKNDQYQVVYQEKKKWVVSSLIFYIKKNTLDYPRLGLSVSKKMVRNAVDRNKIKRINREHFRFRQEKLAGFDIIVVARKEIRSILNKGLFGCLGDQWNCFLDIFEKL